MFLTKSQIFWRKIREMIGKFLSWKQNLAGARSLFIQIIMNPSPILYNSLISLLFLCVPKFLRLENDDSQFKLYKIWLLWISTQVSIFQISVYFYCSYFLHPYCSTYFNYQIFCSDFYSSFYLSNQETFSQIKNSTLWRAIMVGSLINRCRYLHSWSHWGDIEENKTYLTYKTKCEIIITRNTTLFFLLWSSVRL